MASNAAVRRAVLDRIADFRVAYAKALLSFTTGNRAASFPSGTWKLRRHLRLNCCSPP